MSRPQLLATGRPAVLWVLGLATWLLAQAWMSSALGVAWLSSYVWVLALSFLALGWCWVDEVVVSSEGLAWVKRWAPGLILMVLGQSLCQPRYEEKETLVPLGLGLISLGLAWVWPFVSSRARLISQGLGGLTALVGYFIWNARGRIQWELFGDWTRARPMVALWWSLFFATIITLVFVVLRRPAAIPEKGQVLRPKLEALSLGAILALGALFRFWKAGRLPENYWYDEVMFLQGIHEHVINSNKAPIYIVGLVQNPGGYFWVLAAWVKALGSQVETLRYAASFFGFLAILPFWGLARLWLGQRWALVATLSFAVMRWVAIPQRIGFMTGFATLWMLSAFWALWWAWSRGRRSKEAVWIKAARWALVGFLLGANLHTYIPGRMVPVVALAFLILQALTDKEWRLKRWAWGALALGFLISGGPMLAYVYGHWNEYVGRMRDVSLYGDAINTGRPFWPQLWANIERHLLMFTVKGDFNARHNIYFMPQVDAILGLALCLGAPWALGRALKDSRARFLWIWILPMVAGGILSITSEAPQAHRTILLAPALPLMAAFALRELLPRASVFFGGPTPFNFKALALVLLGGLVLSNGYDLLLRWPHEEATFRSFSPGASSVARRFAQAGPGTWAYTSTLKHDYPFTGYEWTLFASQAAVHGKDLAWANFEGPTKVGRHAGNRNTERALFFWGNSDKDFEAALQQQFPDLKVENLAYPYVDKDMPLSLYRAMEIPVSRLSVAPSQGTAPFISLQPN